MTSIPTSPAGFSLSTQVARPPLAIAHQRSAQDTDRWDAVAEQLEARGLKWGAYYHERMAEVYRLIIPEGQRVLELGSARGDLLAALKPAHSVGIDRSPKMLSAARERHPELEFVDADADDLSALQDREPFDYIILSDLINGLHDVQSVFEQVAAICAPHTRVVINTYSRLWEMPLAIANKLGVARPFVNQNWLTTEDTQNLLQLSGFETLRTWQEVLCPLRVPLVHSICNRYLAKLSPFRHLALSNFIIARPAAKEMKRDNGTKPTVSVIVAARNEAGNIEQIIERTPEMGGGTELIFVEGGSSDDTFETIKQSVARRPEACIKVMQQDGKGKGDAVRKGFAAATGDILMILDADLTVPPEDLPRFYEALVSGRGEYINGVRLVYPMEEEAMRFCNTVGNKFFSLAFSWLLGQPIKDTLCGTKVMTRKNYEALAANRHYFGDFDPFGDFDLIFGAAKMNLKMIDLPIRYQARTYGDTNISRWTSGAILLRMTLYAARRLKFV